MKARDLFTNYINVRIECGKTLCYNTSAECWGNPGITNNYAVFDCENQKKEGFNQ